MFQPSICYLKNSLSKIEQNSGKPGILTSKLKDIIDEGINGLSKYIAPKDADSSESVCSQFQKMLEDQTETHLEILAGLLIYAQTGYTVTNGWPERHPSVLPNIYMGTKKEIQEKFSLQSRYQGASKLVIINFAGTSFLSGRLVDSTVDSKIGRAGSTTPCKARRKSKWSLQNQGQQLQRMLSVTK